MKKDQVPDEILIRQVILGETASFKEIVVRYQKQIYNIGMRFFKNYEDASDFVQEVFIRAFNNLRTFKGKSPFKHWLTKVAYNFGINQVHGAKLESDISSCVVPAREDSPEESHLSNEIKGLLEQAINELPERYRVAVDLYFYMGLTYNQIHDITGVPVNTIKSDVLRAKQILRDALKGTIVEDYHEI
ncbi:MAG TPA: sigma-70 family RNA polymerase sigma factor [Spirochaetota bacterium]|nr:sigma-70 family RNA polymerase sigma factor [Spirochaetota bacterium]